METCENCLHYDICIFHITGNENEECRHYTPTADVVPKSEVAREIFEEVEKEVLLSLPVSSYIDAPRTTQNKIWNTIAELKKKYTEEV